MAFYTTWNLLSPARGAYKTVTVWPCSGHSFCFWVSSIPTSLQFGENSPLYGIGERQFFTFLWRSLREEIFPLLWISRAQAPPCRTWNLVIKEGRIVRKHSWAPKGWDQWQPWECHRSGTPSPWASKILFIPGCSAWPSLVPPSSPLAISCSKTWPNLPRLMWFLPSPIPISSHSILSVYHSQNN